MENFKDFDKALEKADKKELQIKVAGKVYDLPAALPARTVLEQMRFAESGNDLPFEAIPQWIASLIGDEKLQQMLEDGVTWDQMNELLEYLMGVYGLNTEEDAEAEEEDSTDPK